MGVRKDLKRAKRRTDLAQRTGVETVRELEPGHWAACHLY